MFELTKEEYQKKEKEFRNTYIGKTLYQSSKMMEVLLAILAIIGLIFFYNLICVSLIKEIGNLKITEVTAKSILPLLFFIIFITCLRINTNLEKEYFSAFITFTERKK